MTQHTKEKKEHALALMSGPHHVAVADAADPCVSHIVEQCEPGGAKAGIGDEDWPAIRRQEGLQLLPKGAVHFERGRA